MRVAGRRSHTLVPPVRAAPSAAPAPSCGARPLCSSWPEAGRAAAQGLGCPAAVSWTFAEAGGVSAGRGAAAELPQHDAQWPGVTVWVGLVLVTQAVVPEGMVALRTGLADAALRSRAWHWPLMMLRLALRAQAEGIKGTEGTPAEGHGGARTGY